MKLYRASRTSATDRVTLAAFYGDPQNRYHIEAYFVVAAPGLPPPGHSHDSGVIALVYKRPVAPELSRAPALRRELEFMWAAQRLVDSKNLDFLPTGTPVWIEIT